MSVTIKYNGSNVATVEGGKTATLPVKSKKMVTDIIVTVPESKGEVLPDHTESDFTLQLANIASGELGVVYSSTEKVAFDAAPNGEVIETFFDVHFVPSNIKKDVEIFGVTGEYGGGGGASADDRVKYVTYMDRGAELIKYPVIEGDTARDPVAKGYIEKPTKEPTESTVYTQDGWSKTDGGAPDSTALQNVTEDRTVYAAFTESARKYTVNFYDGDTLVHTEQVGYGGSSSYKAEKEGAFFDRWEPAPENITSDMDCYAQWIDSVNFATASWSEIAWVCENGLAQQMFAVGDTRKIKCGFVGWQNLETFEIIAFDHDDLADGSGKATITLMCKTPFFTGYGKADMNSTNTNRGGWGNCKFRTTLANKITTMPEDLQPMIKTVKKDYNAGNTTEVSYSNDKLWIPSLYEVGCGAEPNVYPVPNISPDLGTPYSSITDPALGISDYRYFTRNAVSTSTTEFYCVVNNSSKGPYAIETKAYDSGLSLSHIVCFCI